MQERLDATRASIVGRAHALVAERGYAGCSVALVATGAGVATGTVYRHFPDKGALFAEVFRAATQREVDAVTAAAAKPGTVAERVAAVVETFARRALRSPRLAYALIAEPVDPQVEAERLTYRRAYRDIFAALIADAVAAGDLPPQDARGVGRRRRRGDGRGARRAAAGRDGSTTDSRTVPELTAFVTRSIGATP